jgi:hypothetical protein
VSASLLLLQGIALTNSRRSTRPEAEQAQALVVDIRNALQTARGFVKPEPTSPDSVHRASDFDLQSTESSGAAQQLRLQYEVPSELEPPRRRSASPVQNVSARDEVGSAMPRNRTHAVHTASEYIKLIEGLRLVHGYPIYEEPQRPTR